MSTSQSGPAEKSTTLGDLPRELVLEIGSYVAEGELKPGVNPKNFELQIVYEDDDDNNNEIGPRTVKFDDSHGLSDYFSSEDDNSGFKSHPSDYEDNFCSKGLAGTTTASGIKSLRNFAYSCKELYDILLPLLYAESGEEDDWYALRWGCFHGSILVLERAVAAGAPLDYAFQYTFETEFWRVFLSGAKHDRQFSARTRNAGTPLLTAIHGGQVEAVEWLLSHGASPTLAKPSVQRSDYWPGFGPAMCNTCSHKHGPDHHCGVTPIQGALDYLAHGARCVSGIRSEADRIQILRCLIERGADINERFVHVSLGRHTWPGGQYHLQSIPRQHQNALGLALFTPSIGPQTVQFLLEKGAHFEMGRNSLLLPFLTHMSHCNIQGTGGYTCESKARVLLSRHTPHKECACVPSYNGLERVKEAELYGQETYRGPHLGRVLCFLREHELPIFDSELDSTMSKAQPSLIKAAYASTRSATVPDAVRLLVEAGADPNEPYMLNRDLPPPQEDRRRLFAGWAD
ncbi:hypothetical protein ColTof3_03666 [Colletotrichum tofieldiae]|nr:hypothetical protein ColTof3_03666 [Colletotrichum tofieldiae]